MHQTPHTLFISDLHLGEQTPALSAHFNHFLKHAAPGAEALYILGDFFELWLGADVQTKFHAEIKHALKTLSDQGTHIFFMRGNRDFLLRDSDLVFMGMTPLSDPQMISLYGKKFLLTHGDRLCTLDVSYQRYRRVVNLPFLQRLFLYTPKNFRKYLAKKIHHSNPHQATSRDLSYIKADATHQGILKDLTMHQPDYIIHGHTHRMGLHWFKDKIRIVLGDWKQDYFNYLYVSEDNILLKSCEDQSA